MFNKVNVSGPAAVNAPCILLAQPLACPLKAHGVVFRYVFQKYRQQ